MIDRNAPTLEPVNGEVAMPTTENAAPYRFAPVPGALSSADVMEITLMLLLQLTGGPQCQPGALRNQLLQAERFAQLSPEAQRHMQPQS